MDSEEEPQPKKVASQESEEESTAAPVAKQRAFILKAAAAPKRLADEPVSNTDAKRAAVLPRQPARAVEAGESEEEEEEESEADAQPEPKQKPAVVPKAAPAPAPAVALAAPKIPRPAVGAAKPVASVAARPSLNATAAPAPATVSRLVPKTGARPSSAGSSAEAAKPPAPRPSVVAAPVRNAIPKSGVSVPQVQAPRIHSSVKPPVPRAAEAVKKTPAPAGPLRPVQRPAGGQTLAASKATPATKKAVVKAMQGQIADMLSTDSEEEENIPRSKQTAVRAVLDEIDGMLSD